MIASFLKWYDIMRTSILAHRSVQNKTLKNSRCLSVFARKKVSKNVKIWGIRKRQKNIKSHMSTRLKISEFLVPQNYELSTGQSGLGVYNIYYTNSEFLEKKSIQRCTLVIPWSPFFRILGGFGGFQIRVKDYIAPTGFDFQDGFQVPLQIF